MSKSNFLILVFVLLFVGMLLVVFPCHYLVNDDIGILLDILGGFEVSFMSALLGRALSFFYLNIPNDIPWYSLFFYLLHVLSLFLFIKSLLKIERFRYLCFPFLMVYLLFYSNFIIAITYTVTAIMIGANSLFAFLIYLQASKKSFFVVALLGVAFSFSHLVREKALQAIVVFSLPILFFVLFSRIRDYKYWIIFFIPVLLVFGTNRLVRVYGATQQYKNFIEFNKIRSKFHDRPEKREYKKILEVNGWTENDYKLLRWWWFCSDERKFNTDTLKNFLTYSVQKPMSDSVQKPMSVSVQKPMSDSVQKPMSDSVQKPVSEISFSSLLSFVKKTFKRRSGYGFFGLFGCIWMLSFTLLTLKDLLLFNVYGLYCVGILGYIAKFYRLPFRVGAPVFLMITGLLVYLIFARGDQSSRKFSRITQFIFIIVVFFLFALEALNLYNYIEKKVKIEGVAFNNGISKLNTEYADAVFFPQILSLKIEYLSPLKPIKLQFHLINSGWGTYSPRFYQNIENALGIRHGYELLLKMVDNDKAFFITRDEKFNSCLITYMKETFNLNVTFIKVDEFSTSNNIYKARTVDSF